MTEPRPGAQSSKTGLTRRLAVVTVLALAIVAVLYFKGAQTSSTGGSPPRASARDDIAAPVDAANDEPAPKEALPRLVDLGADKCIPCKMMAPILEELRQEYAGRFEVVFIDVWKNESEARKHGIRVIPTQIFFDAAGKELFRHQGFFSREDILETWREHGFDFEKGAAVERSS
jgi:thioredoxin 1